MYGTQNPELALLVILESLRSLSSESAAVGGISMSCRLFAVRQNPQPVGQRRSARSVEDQDVRALDHGEADDRIENGDAIDLSASQLAEKLKDGCPPAAIEPPRQ
jgi:hypothetical protein